MATTAPEMLPNFDETPSRGWSFRLRSSTSDASPKLNKKRLLRGSSGSTLNVSRSIEIPTLFTGRRRRNSNTLTVSSDASSIRDFNSSMSSFQSGCIEEDDSSSCLKVKTQSESLRRSFREQSTGLIAESFPQSSSMKRHVSFGMVTAHYHYSELAGADEIPAYIPFGEPPFLRLGECFESREYESLDVYLEESGACCSSRWGEKYRHKNSSKMRPLRVYARERTLQKSGYSIQEIRESVVAFNRSRHSTK